MNSSYRKEKDVTNSLVEMESLLDMSAPVQSSKLIPRWQRKSSKENRKTPKRTPRRRKASPPSCKKSATKQDRFIPQRSAMDFENCNYLLTKAEDGEEEEEETYRKSLATNLLGQEVTDSRVLAFRNKAPAPSEDFHSNLRVLYSQNKPKSVQIKPTRHISSAPCRILDAPELMDDYYLNLLSWSQSNVLAVALGPTVYLWNAATGSIEELMTCEDEDDYISSVSWMEQPGATHLAIGTSDSTVQLWDASAQRRVRTMDGHSSRVGSMAWNQHILSSGSRDSTIVHHDVRVQQHKISTLTGHEQEICGLKWSTDGKYLASGGNDNMLCIWNGADSGARQTARSTLTGHTAAVKALAWCPWERHVLASGGGSADRTIKFWNASNGALLQSKDTGSQVCSLLWSTTEKELLSSHGYSQNELCLWKYPTMSKIKEFHGHTARVLHLAASPDSSMVVSAAADETLRFWNIFAPASSKSIKMPSIKSKAKLSTIMGIR